ncbi:hypothetical protein [Chachezhania antarctica]|uniref:hypothetical protein n=1 Tax=Chachezhania antarctica TaxID=2340860 RepID=UPI000EB3E756|nr:hypothetical protein [Chachezhania antarctica]
MTTDDVSLAGLRDASIMAFAGSNTIRNAVVGDVVDQPGTGKRFEWGRYLSALSEWKRAEFFSIFQAYLPLIAGFRRGCLFRL